MSVETLLAGHPEQATLLPKDVGESSPETTDSLAQTLANEAKLGASTAKAVAKEQREARIKERRELVIAKREAKGKTGVATVGGRIAEWLSNAPENTKKAFGRMFDAVMKNARNGQLTTEAAIAQLAAGGSFAVPADVLREVDARLAEQQATTPKSLDGKFRGAWRRATFQVSEQGKQRAVVLEGMKKAFDGNDIDAAGDAYANYRLTCELATELGCETAVAGAGTTADAMADFCHSKERPVTAHVMQEIAGLLQQYQEAGGSVTAMPDYKRSAGRLWSSGYDVVKIRFVSGSRSLVTLKTAAALTTMGVAGPVGFLAAGATGAALGAMSGRANARTEAQEALRRAVAEKRGLDYASVEEAQSIVSSGDVSQAKGYVKSEGRKGLRRGAGGGALGGLGFGAVGWGIRDMLSSSSRPVTLDSSHITLTGHDTPAPAAQHVATNFVESTPPPQKLDVHSIWADNDIGHHKIAFDESHQLGMGSQVIKEGDHNVIELTQKGGKANYFVFEVKDPKTGHFRNIAVAGVKKDGVLTLKVDPTSSDNLTLSTGGTIPQNELAGAVLDTDKLQALHPTGHDDLSAKAEHRLFQGVKTVNSAHIDAVRDAHGNEVPRVTFTASLDVENHMKTGTVTLPAEAPSGGGSVGPGTGTGLGTEPGTSSGSNNGLGESNGGGSVEPGTGASNGSNTGLGESNGNAGSLGGGEAENPPLQHQGTENYLGVHPDTAQLLATDAKLHPLHGTFLQSQQIHALTDAHPEMLGTISEHPEVIDTLIKHSSLTQKWGDQSSMLMDMLTQRSFTQLPVPEQKGVLALLENTDNRGIMLGDFGLSLAKYSNFSHKTIFSFQPPLSYHQATKLIDAMANNNDRGRSLDPHSIKITSGTPVGDIDQLVSDAIDPHATEVAHHRTDLESLEIWARDAWDREKGLSSQEHIAQAAAVVALSVVVRDLGVSFTRPKSWFHPNHPARSDSRLGHLLSSLGWGVPFPGPPAAGAAIGNLATRVSEKAIGIVRRSIDRTERQLGLEEDPAASTWGETFGTPLVPVSPDGSADSSASEWDDLVGGQDSPPVIPVSPEGDVDRNGGLREAVVSRLHWLGVYLGLLAGEDERRSLRDSDTADDFFSGNRGSDAPASTIPPVVPVSPDRPGEEPVDPDDVGFGGNARGGPSIGNTDDDSDRFPTL
jgi:hypothetical protein